MKSNFKIIAIKALDECDPKYTKVLVKNELYYFYSDYRIEIKEEFEELIFKETSPLDLFNIKGKDKEIAVNLSAIVGKNGSGKSSIIELLFRGINNIAYNYLWLTGIQMKTITANLKVVEGVHMVFYYHSDAYYKVEIHNSDFNIFRFNKENKIFKKDTSLHTSFELMDFFYTEAVNYSHYAYNSLEFGYFKKDIFIDWLEELFHKNDSYQTPLVLNPMRTKGNFDINRENDLVKQRLLANILRLEDGKINFRKFGDNLEAKSLRLKLKPKKIIFSFWVKNSKNRDVEIKYNLGIYSKEERRKIITQLMMNLVEDKTFDPNILDGSVYSHAEMYIIYKITSICKKYIEYNRFLDEKGKRISTSKFDQLIKQLTDDTSHITFKLKQTLNFLKKDYINFKENELEMPISALSKKINNNLKKEQLILEHIPPPIFDIEIILENINTKKEVSFSTLSSGEKQLVYLVSSLLYHLYNLDSVTGYKVKYKNINIILEEIELYFHPDYQKSFIKYFLDSIEMIELKNIESINISFITHSPFILSDIPSNNIMFLEVVDGKAIQKKEKRKTFGANIHELLTDNFFMSNGFIGDFAKDKINKTIEWLNEELIKKRKFENEKQSEKFKFNSDEFKFHKGIISLIDEPIIKIKLSEMLFEIDNNNDDFHDNLILEQINYLKEKLIKKEIQ